VRKYLNLISNFTITDNTLNLYQESASSKLWKDFSKQFITTFSTYANNQHIGNFALLNIQSSAGSRENGIISELFNSRRKLLGNRLDFVSH